MHSCFSKNEIGEFSQGTKSIQEYYSSFMNLWIEYISIETHARLWSCTELEPN